MVKTTTEKIASVKRRRYNGFVYNATTSSGNYFANGVLVHNSGGLGTPAYMRVECVLPETVITLADGDAVKAKDLIKIGAVAKEESVAGAKIAYLQGVNVAGLSGFKCVSAPLYRVIERFANEEVYEIKTRFGERLCVTGNHLIAAMRDGGINYVPAKDLTLRTSIVKPRLMKTHSAKELDCPVFEKAVSWNAVHLQIQKITSEFCYWLGSMLSDGDFTALQYASVDRDLCAKVSDCFGMATGFRSKVYPHGKYFFTSFNRKEVYRLIENFGLSGKGALEKEIPKTFMSLPDEQTAELIAGLFDGDGSLTRDGELIFASTSWKLALQVRNLLLRFGIQTSLRQQNKNRKNPLHSIRTSDAEDVQKFIENIPCAKKSIVKNALQRRCINSKTMKRKTIPRVFGLLDDVRKKLFLLQDEVIPNRVFANYYRSDPSFKKTEFILNVFKNRIDELQLLSSSSLNADWTQIRQAAKKLNLSYEKITRISEKNFSWNYGSKSKAGLVYYQKFFSEICLKAVREALQPLKTLEEILRGDVAFDEVVRIEKRNYEGSVYDLTTLTGNFFANGMLTHNCGAIHRANKGVLFIDEVSALSPKAQQELLTAMQEKKYSITGQSEMSSGAMVRTQSVPCDFVLVAAGNYKDIAKMHPALRNRIRGYGYEIYMDESIADNPQNRAKLVQFIAQEVRKDGKIPHFDRSAVDEIINEARKRSGRKNKLTLKLRELGGLVRAAGDLAREENAKLVSREHVLRAKVLARTLEQQAAEQMIDLRRDYKIFLSKGKQVGKVNGLAVMGDSGVILPIVAEVAPAASRQEGKIIATGKLGSIAKEAVENVSAIIKRHTGKDTTSYDIHIQFLQTFEGVEGDSASVSVAAAVISALEEAPIRQEVALTGSLSVRGEVLPVGGVTQKAEAAIEAGMSEIIVPAANVDDLVLDEKQRAKIRIVPASNILDVLRACLAESPKKQRLLAAIEAEF